jgi:hypothetical protein
MLKRAVVSSAGGALMTRTRLSFGSFGGTRNGSATPVSGKSCVFWSRVSSFGSQRTSNS